MKYIIDYEYMIRVFMNKMLNKSRFHTHLHYVISEKETNSAWQSMQKRIPRMVTQKGASGAGGGGGPLHIKMQKKITWGDLVLKKLQTFFHFHVLQPKRTTTAYSATDRSLHCEHFDILHYKVLT